MTIDKSGEWWKGSGPSDIDEYLSEFTADSYPVHALRPAKCICGSDIFKLDVDEDEGAAMRKCVECGHAHLLCDSGEYWAEAEPERCECPCGSENMNITIGFSLYPENGEVKWLYIGCRCSTCGILGCYADWKIGYEPSRHLFEQV